MIALVSSAKEVASGLVPLLPALLAKAGTEAVGEFAKKFGEESWSGLKSVWQDLTAKSSEAGKLVSSAEDLSGNPQDKEALETFQHAIQDVLRQDPDFADGLVQRVRRHSQRPTMKTTHGAQISLADQATLHARDIDMSVRVGPTMDELDKRDDRQLIRRALAQFDRRAIHEDMHAETLWLMIQSLHKLRVNLQELGVSTLQDRTVRLLFRQVQDAILEIEALSGLLAKEAHSHDDWEDSIFHFTTFGGLEQFNHPVALSQAAQIRLDEVRMFLNGQVSYFRNATVAVRSRDRDTPAESHARSKPLNTERLRVDMLCIYLFGMIDQLKSRIIATVELIESQI